MDADNTIFHHCIVSDYDAESSHAFIAIDHPFRVTNCKAYDYEGREISLEEWARQADEFLSRADHH